MWQASFLWFLIIATGSTIIIPPKSVGYEMPNTSMDDNEMMDMIRKLSPKERLHIFDKNIGNTCNDLKRRGRPITGDDARRMFIAMTEGSMKNGWDKDAAYKLADITMASIYLKCPEVFDIR